ncbi:unnamed protein product [Lota lota]
MSLKEDRCYGLASGPPRHHVSVFHVKLTDCAARAIDTFHNTKSEISQPTICFAGDQGRITVPCSDSGQDKRVFAFGLTNMVRHIPHGSFDCVRQLATSEASGQLSRVGLIQQRLTVQATDASYQKACQNMAQVEEETRKRAAIVIKDNGRVQKKRVMVRAPAPALVNLARPRHPIHSLPGGNQRRRPGAEGGRSARVGMGAGADGLEMEKRPIRERLVHLLGVRPYRRADLLLRLQKDGLTDGEKDSLDELLLEVGQLNSRDKTLVLKDRLYSELQKDWPGYTPVDQQLLRRILVRRLFKPHKNPLLVPGTQVSPLRDTPNSSPARPHKPCVTEEHTQSTTPVNKKPRVSHVPAGRGVTVATGDQPTPPPRKHPTRSANRMEAGGDITVTTEDVKYNNKNNSNGRGNSLDPRRLSDSLSAVCQQREEKEEVSERLQPSFSCSTPRSRESPALLPQPGPPPQAAPAASPHPKGPKTDRRMKKRRKSRLREQEKVRSGDKKERTGASNPGELKIKVTSDCTDTNGALRDSGVLQDAGNMTDFLSAYTVIRGHEQRLRYKQDFNQEYSEYRGLHARIDGVTRQFMKLNTQLKQLRHGSNKYKTIRNQILQEYRTIKKFNPNYNQDKVRCEYLHNKLAHIKKLISVYDNGSSVLTACE